MIYRPRAATPEPAVQAQNPVSQAFTSEIKGLETSWKGGGESATLSVGPGRFQGVTLRLIWATQAIAGTRWFLLSPQMVAPKVRGPVTRRRRFFDGFLTPRC